MMYIFMFFPLKVVNSFQKKYINFLFNNIVIKIKKKKLKHMIFYFL